MTQIQSIYGIFVEKMQKNSDLLSPEPLSSIPLTK